MYTRELLRVFKNNPETLVGGSNTQVVPQYLGDTKIEDLHEVCGSGEAR